MSLNGEPAMKEQIQVPKELMESLLNSVNGDFYMGKE
jgi:hypothetical protein